MSSSSPCCSTVTVTIGSAAKTNTDPVFELLAVPVMARQYPPLPPHTQWKTVGVCLCDYRGRGLEMAGGIHARLAELAAEAAGCRNCGLWEHATQTVFGEGDPHTPIVLVGEQPGDAEDRAGRPFVGPAGRILDEAFSAAGLGR